MQLAKREWRRWGRWRGLIGAITVGAVLGVMGPFGSQTAYSTTIKYSFWMVLALVGFGAVVAADRLISSTGAGPKNWTRIVAVAAASALPMTFFVAWAMGFVRPGRSFGPLQLLGLYPYVALVQLLIARVTIAEEPAVDAARPEQAVAPPQYPTEFLTKLPPALRRDILALEAEDHYVRVHTLHGSALVLMRLADAAALIDPRLGLRVHRSWWVAKDAVGALETGTGRPIARLVNDTPVPISRSHLPAARKVLVA